MGMETFSVIVPVPIVGCSLSMLHNEEHGVPLSTILRFYITELKQKAFYVLYYCKNQALTTYCTIIKYYKYFTYCTTSKH